MRFSLLATIFPVLFLFLPGRSQDAPEASEIDPIPVRLPQREEETPSPTPWALEPWTAWVKSAHPEWEAPPRFDNGERRLLLWPSELEITADAESGRFAGAVRVFAPAWLSLPGNSEVWPQEVAVDGNFVPVVERAGRPAIRLDAGQYRIEGRLPWETMPQRLDLPPEIGIVRLTREGKRVELPNWDANGFLWLKRNRAEEEAEREFLDAKVYRLLEDGIPMWLQTEIELSVAGKSREEDLGFALPEGWEIASVESKLPCALENSGRLRVQVRAGKWVIAIRAFRNRPLDEFRYSDSTQPMVGEEILGFQAKPDFRVVELEDIQPIDVSQTTFPEKWRNLPVYRWETAQPFQLEEKMRGMGFQKTAGLRVNREFWLDDDGDLMTFRDRISGASQQSWRLDISPGQVLGAARLRGEGQLITKNPETGASGIEIRERNIEIEAVGRIDDAAVFPASGWQADVDQCEAKLHLPPGWRVLALFGAEYVRGDWLTNWSLLDLFLLLVFTMAVGKLWGWRAAAIAFLGFGLTFHEPGAPRFLWFLLLVPVAILRVGVEGKVRSVVEVAKYAAFALLLVFLVPFVGGQIQGVLYPQLESGVASPERPGVRRLLESTAGSEVLGRQNESATKQWRGPMQTSNLMQDVQARIQTGPAVPAWTWREVGFGRRGPVTESEKVRVLLISPTFQRLITMLRVVLLILLVALLMGAKRLLPPFLCGGKVAILGGALFIPAGMVPSAQATDFPPQYLLDELEKRLSEPSDAFPRAAEIPLAKVAVQGDALIVEAEIHAATRTAVPLPGKFPLWSPLSVTVDGTAAEAVVRQDGYLWIALESGVHQVRVEGRLSPATEWSWSFLLKPRMVAVDAPGWTVTGVGSGGVPEDQVFFVRQSPQTDAEAAYDRRDFQPAVAVEREFEIGLVWQVRSSLQRLTSGGKAVALSIPLLPGERVLASDFNVENGRIDVRLGANQQRVSWESELPQTDQLILESTAEDSWVERWKLLASPVWNVTFEGLSPVYESGGSGLRPVWNPWPGETVNLSFSRPEAIPGATMTVRSVEHDTRVGTRQRASRLQLDLQASLGQDFSLELAPVAEVTSLKIGDEVNPGGARQPVRRDGDRIVIPVRPGEQTIDLEWQTPRRISLRETVDRLELPVEASNIRTTISLPQDRWVLWTYGPLRGPSVRLWGIVLLSLVGAFVLGRLTSSPLRGSEWGLLALGLTQVHPLAILLVIAWFFLIAWRGSDRGVSQGPIRFNLLQLLIIFLAIPVIVIVLVALHRGLLGVPEMMVQGNASSSTELKWFEQRTDGTLPAAGVLSVSIWFYRILMLAWALWLAISALRWVRWGWDQFSRQGLWKGFPRKVLEK